MNHLGLKAYLDLAKRIPSLFASAAPPSYEILLAPKDIRTAQEEAKTKRSEAGQPSQDLRVGILAQDPYLQVLRDAVRFADGSLGLYNRLMVPSGVVVLPQHENKLVLIRRYRHGTRAVHIEALRGSLVPGKSIEEQAGIEVHEEIGATLLQSWRVGTTHNSSGCSNETHHLLFGRIDGPGKLDLHEAIAGTVCVSPPEFAELIKCGEITDAPTLAVFLHAMLANLIQLRPRGLARHE
jgi:ADP-ribose pyrophosphatase